jgi:N-acyl-D-amino-acid deacylase
MNEGIGKGAIPIRCPVPFLKEPPMQFDTVLRGGTVVAGTGGLPQIGSVGVVDGVIVAVGEIPSGAADKEIDATGLIVAPGFIDIHTHSDVTAMLDPKCQSKVLQGVTTEVTGNCGFSPFPFAADAIDLHSDHLHRIGDGVPPLTWHDLDGYSDAVEANPPALNIAPLVGHGTIRVAVLGVDQREPSLTELEKMKDLLDASLRQGAFGMSTGLTHVPSAYAAEDEVTELVKVVARHHALYATHMRGGTGGWLDAFEEAIRTATAAGARLQASHAAINHPDHWGRAADVLTLVDEARASGLDAAIDVYPYDASSSSLTHFVQKWVQDGGTEAMRDRLSDPATFERAEGELSLGWFGDPASIPWLWDKMIFDRTGPGDEWMSGLSIEAAARESGTTPAALTLRVCSDHGNYARVVVFYRTEGDMMSFLSYPHAVVGSDGVALPMDQGTNRPHPRSFGTFPRIFGRYVRDKGLITMAEAVRKTSGAVADRLQMTDRGYVRPGMIADLAIFNPDTIADRATFDDPAQGPIGIDYVMVGGELAVDGGIQTDARQGKVLRRQVTSDRLDFC